jgi:hypothetical protein
MEKKFHREQLEEIFNSLDVWVTRLANNKKIGAPAASKELEALIFQLLVCNHSLWNQEDFARRRDVDDSLIVAAKRTIDTLNQQRNDIIEKIDIWLVENHYKQLGDRELPLRTETPGSVFDRLSILSLKVYYMFDQTRRKDVDAAHRNTCAGKLEILKQQQRNLQQALKDMILALNRGSIKMVLYRQFKMYNDPSLNPQLYRPQESKGL